VPINKLLIKLQPNTWQIEWTYGCIMMSICLGLWLGDSSEQQTPWRSINFALIFFTRENAKLIYLLCLIIVCQWDKHTLAHRGAENWTRHMQLSWTRKAA